MSLDVNALLNGQRDIQGRIGRAVDNLKKMGTSNITLSAVETRIKMLDQLWTKFEDQHDLVRTNYKDKFEESEYVTSDFFDTTELTYVQQRSKLVEYANQFQSTPSTSAPQREHSFDHAPKTALPRIKLQPFSGAYEDWPTFRDLFQSVIGENSSVSNIERFHYLRSCLQGPAEKLIRPLAVTGENYDRAWTILSKHFENKKELIRSNFSTFTAVTKMKGETAEELSRVYHAITTAVNAQESIGRPITSHGMDLFNHLVVELFDPRTRLEWETSTSDSVDPPEHEALLNFISKRILTLNAAKPRSISKAVADPSRSAKAHFAKRSDSFQCALCKEKHSIMTCGEFKAKPVNERKSIIENSRLCYNCFGNHPVAKCQSSKNCFTCKSRHHSMLHDAYVTQKPTEVSTLSATHKAEDRKATLLATARVTVADRYDNPHPIRALIDQGSEVSIVSEDLVQRLRLQRARSAVSIVGIGGAQSVLTHGKVTLNLSSNTTGAKFTTVAFILPRLSLYKGSAKRSNRMWPHIQGLPLADPQFQSDDSIELLLAAEVCSMIFEDGLCKGGPHAPMAQKTKLEWIFSGGYSMTSQGHRSSFQCTADNELVELVRRFWEQETEPIAPVSLTPEEEKCEEIFVRTHRRTAAGRYVVRLPLSAPPTTLAETRKPAERLLTSMERKCGQDSRFGGLYREFMREYENLQHMELVSASSDIETKFKCYLPHHGVLRESSTTTKLRVVFNRS